MTTMKQLPASAAEMIETLQTSTVAWLLHQPKLYGSVAERMALLKKTEIKSLLKSTWETPWSSGKMIWPDKNKMEIFGY